MTANRRRFLSGAGAAIVAAIGIGAGTSVTADGHDIPVVIASVDVKLELVTLENTGDEDIDLSQYMMDWEYNGDDDQTDVIGNGEGDTTIEAGGQLTLATGGTSGGEPVPDADVTFGYGEDDEQIADDGSDVIALLSPGRNAVATFDPSDGTQGPGDGGGDGDDGGDGDGDGGDGGDGEDADDDGETVEDGEEVDDDDSDDDSDDSDDDDSDDSDDDDSDDSDDDDSDGGDESAGDDTEDCPDCDEDHAADEDCPEEEPEPEPEEDDC